jgi:trehalose 6-phosphate synthase
MNLVAKEAPIVNDRDAVLLLSTEAGAWYDLRGAAVGLDPRSVDDTVRAMEAAVEMPAHERLARAAYLRHAIESHDIWDWLEAQYDDLTQVGGASRHREVGELTTA